MISIKQREDVMKLDKSFKGTVVKFRQLVLLAVGNLLALKYFCTSQKFFLIKSWFPIIVLVVFSVILVASGTRFGSGVGRSGLVIIIVFGYLL